MRIELTTEEIERGFVFRLTCLFVEWEQHFAGIDPIHVVLLDPIAANRAIRLDEAINVGLDVCEILFVAGRAPDLLKPFQHEAPLIIPFLSQRGIARDSRICHSHRPRRGRYR